MRIDPNLRRIRAVVRTAAVTVAYKAGVIGAAFTVPYISFRYALGEFFKQKFLTDIARVSEGEVYFAEDYTDPGYVGVPFSIVFSKVLADSATATDALALRTSRGFNESAALADVVALAPRLAIIDQPVASDSGNLRMQSYCDISYFAEDYVGVSRAFT